MRMSSLISSVVLAAGLGLVTNSAQATLITFDDLSGNYISVPNGYEGLNWANWRTLAPGTYPNVPTGYQNSVVSPGNIIWQAADINGTNTSGIFSSTPFTLNSFYATAAWRDDLTVTVTGYLNHILQNTQVFAVSTSGPPTLEAFNWTNIDQVNILTSGGIPHAGFPYADYEIALDNLTINVALDNSPIDSTPLPSTWTMLLLGLTAFGFVCLSSSEAESCTRSRRINT